MAIAIVDIDFKRPSSIVQEVIDKYSREAAMLVLVRANMAVGVGKVKRAAYVKGKGKNKSWTSRAPGRLMMSGAVHKSKFSHGGAVVMYGSFDAFYGFMHHWGVRNRYGKTIRANKFLTKSAAAEHGKMNAEAASRLKKALK